MRMAAVVARLQDQCPDVRQVLSALSGAVPTAYPAVYVLPLQDSADANPFLGAHSQIVTARFALEIMLKHGSQADSGGPAHEALETLRDDLRAALKGWQPAAEFEPIAYLGGRLIGFEAGMAIWRDEYSTRYDLRT